ncbi:MAG: hypothetical protein A2W23_03775 [Planctomycetes bacterium RBG_16_43_13]|nr:MAG: hypothetical protein A2W23_03775 [Planctomycetes bacterium RBG_16_43_13]
MSRFFSRDLYPVLAIVFLSVYLFFFWLGGNGLWNADEGRYAEGGREMFVSGDFLVPTIDGLPRINKPPLIYWLDAVSYSIFSVNEFAARFFPALFALIGVVMAYYFGKMSWNRRAGFIAGVVLATCGQYIVLARVIVTDMVLASLMALAIFFWFRGYKSPRSGGINYILFYIFCGLAVLTKGPLGLIVPFLAIVPYLAVTGELKRIKEMRPIIGVILILVISLPWFLLVERRYPGYLQYFFVEQNFLAFFESGIHHGRPFYYTFGYLFAGMFPWPLFFLYLVFRLFKIGFGNIRKVESGLLFFILWLALAFLFFTVSKSKSSTYLQPVYLPVAVLVGWLFDIVIREAIPGETNKGMIVGVVLILILVGVGGVYVSGNPTFYLELEHTEEILNVIPMVFLILIGIVFAVLVLLMLYFAIRGRNIAVVFLVALMNIITLPVLIYGSEIYEDRWSSKGVILQAMPLIEEKTQVVAIKNLKIDVAFYTGRAVKVVGDDFDGTFARVENRIGVAKSMGGELERNVEDIFLKHLFMDYDKFSEMLNREPVVGFAETSVFDRMPDIIKSKVKVIAKNYELVAFTNR